MAQTRPQRGFEDQYQRLIQQIQTARELLRLFPDRQAESYIEQAERWAQEAQRMNADRQFVLAQQRLRLAYDALARAFDILANVPAQRTQQQVEELIRRAEQIVPTSGNQEAERLLIRSKEHLQRAREAFRNRQSQRGLEYLRMAKSLAERSLSMAERADNRRGSDIEGERQRFLDLLQKAEPIVADCNNPRAQRLLQQAQRQAESAEPLIHRGEASLAIGLYHNAVRLLLRAIDLCEGRTFSEREEAQEAGELLDALINKVHEEPSSDLYPRRRLILAKVVQLQNQARQAMALQQYGVALRRIELARTLLAQSWSENMTETGAKQELARLESDIERMKTQLPQNQDPRMVAWLSAADQSATDARGYLQNGRIRLALMTVMAGNRFLGMARNLTISDEQQDQQQLLLRIQQRQQQIESWMAKEMNQTNEDLVFAQRLLQNAHSSLMQNDSRLAAEYLRMAEEYVDKVVE